MKKIPAAFLLLFIAFSGAYARANSQPVSTNRLIPQRVALSIAATPFGSVAEMTRKSILSAAEGSTSVYVFSSDPVELQFLHVQSLHGFAVLGISTNGTDYVFSLSFSHGGATNLSAQTVSIPKADLALSFETAGRKLFAMIAAEFPQKAPVEVHETIVERHTVSEFDTVKPTWFLTAEAVYVYRNASVNFNGTNNTHDNFYKIDILKMPALSLGIRYQYRNWHLFLNPSFGGWNGDLIGRIQLGGGVGILKSLLVIEPHLNLQYFFLSKGTDQTFSFYIESGGSNQLVTADTFGLSSLNLAAGISLRFNVSSKFYFVVDLSFISLYTAITLDDQRQEEKLDNLSYADVKLSYRINARMRLNVAYFMGLVDCNGTPTSSSSIAVTAGGETFELGQQKIQNNGISVGIEYEL